MCLSSTCLSEIFSSTYPNICSRTGNPTLIAHSWSPSLIIDILLLSHSNMFLRKYNKQLLQVAIKSGQYISRPIWNNRVQQNIHCMNQLSGCPTHCSTESQSWPPLVCCGDDSIGATKMYILEKRVLRTRILTKRFFNYFKKFRLIPGATFYILRFSLLYI